MTPVIRLRSYSNKNRHIHIMVSSSFNDPGVHCLNLFRAENSRPRFSLAEKYRKRRAESAQKDTDTLTSARASPERPIYFHGITRISDSLIALATRALMRSPSRL